MTRPSHADLDVEGCGSAGCHNYHDNRALYEEFLVEHADEPWLARTPVHTLSARLRSQEPSTDTALGRDDAVAPATARVAADILDLWTGSGHAVAQVNCAACHAPELPDDAPLEEIESAWVTEPAFAVCSDCHRQQANTFARGRHGMRGHPLVAAARDPAETGIGAMLPATIATWLADKPHPAYMTVAEARLPMHADASDRSLDCGACHQPHTVDTRTAAVEALPVLPRRHAQPRLCGKPASLSLARGTFR